VIHPENRFVAFHSQLSLEFCCTEPFLGGGDERNGHHPGPDWQITALHDRTTPDTGSESTGSTLEGKLIFKPIMIQSSTLLTDNSLMDPLFFDEFDTRRFVWKSINEIDNIHGQNRLFRPNLKRVKTSIKQLSPTVNKNLFGYWCLCGYTYKPI
jgi:hypothetical protein